MMVEALVAYGDMSTVLAHHGSMATALGVHGPTATLMVVNGLLITRETRKARPLRQRPPHSPSHATLARDGIRLSVSAGKARRTNFLQ